ncbi:MAG: Butyrate kinase 2 [Firmicutes bacterium ADurb.Bin182]|nr:MAG: Butyrate kinase 2 [Firmicutes bacterium ADurb.Bin182]
MADTFYLLVINPGSTSTKAGIYKNNELLFEKTVRHQKQELSSFGRIVDQKEFRLQVIENQLNQNGFRLEDMDAYVGRGGIVAPLESGVYNINKRMIFDLVNTKAGEHASALGGILAFELGEKYGKPSYVVDPVVVDEILPEARLSGLPEISRRCVWHALNQKAVARRCAKDLGKTYNNCSLIVAHMGGGISVGAHLNGRTVDVNDGLGGEGPFSPERTGGLPAESLIRLCYSGKYTLSELVDFVIKNGGMSAYIGTNDLRVCEERIENGDEQAKLVLTAMAYQVSKEIGAMFVALRGKADAIALTGGLANSKLFTGIIKEYVGSLAPVMIYPGEDELGALAQGALRVLRGEEEAKEYAPR